MGGVLESRCVGRVYGADGAVHYPHRKQRVSEVLSRQLSFLTEDENSD